MKRQLNSETPCEFAEQRAGNDRMNRQTPRSANNKPDGVTDETDPSTLRHALHVRHVGPGAASRGISRARAGLQRAGRLFRARSCAIATGKSNDSCTTTCRPTRRPKRS